MDLRNLIPEIEKIYKKLKNFMSHPVQLKKRKYVTILVLMETPLQSKNQKNPVKQNSRHNPCFNGNSFAI